MYRVIVTGATADERAGIVCSITIEESEDGVSWAAVEGAPGTVGLPLSAVQAALRDPEDDAGRRAALLELFRTRVKSLPVLVGLAYVGRIEELLPAGWPVTVDL